MLNSIYSAESLSAVAASRVLVVGAGGIGCEILKNLVYCGFTSIDLVDLDTIDVSNLNRQFLFRPEHVGKPKAVVAAAAVSQFNPAVTVTAHFGNIKDERFGVSFVRQFSVVLNALDNVDARRHVNRICLAADVLLIDSGTTGYVGQVTSIKRGVTACYDCQPKPSQKVYPVCTIRSTPDKPVHCIVWAKECFRLLFGRPSDSMLFEDESIHASTYMRLVQTTYDATSAAALLTALFQTEVAAKIASETYLSSSRPPAPLTNESIAGSVVKARELLDSRELLRHAIADSGRLWDAHLAGGLFIALAVDISQSSSSSSSHMDGLEFDKDSPSIMGFVAAASALRSHIFGIPVLSSHEAKGVAGNIIPAIATTNAIVAGIQVQQALSVLASHNTLSITDACPHTYCLRSRTRKGLYLQPTAPDKPSPSCFVCGTSMMVLEIDTFATSLDEMLSRAIRGRLGLSSPSVMIGNSCIHEEGEGADEALMANGPKKLVDCPCGGIQDGVVVTVSDLVQDVEANVLVVHRALKDFDTDSDFLLLAQAEYDNLKATRAADASGNSICGVTGKRKRDAEGDMDDDLIE